MPSLKVFCDGRVTDKLTVYKLSTRGLISQHALKYHTKETKLAYAIAVCEAKDYSVNIWQSTVAKYLAKCLFKKKEKLPNIYIWQ